MKQLTIRFTGVIILFFLSLSAFASDVPDDQLKCEKDSDCAVTTSHGCNCSAGGDQVAINSKNKKSWEKKFDDISCIAVVSDDPSCEQKVACVKNKCVMK